MATAFFPDMDGVGTEAGWTPRNMALKSQGHDVGANDYDVVIHFADCRLCRIERIHDEADREAAWYHIHQGYTVTDIYGAFADAEAEGKARLHLRAVHAADTTCRHCPGRDLADPNELPFE